MRTEQAVPVRLADYRPPDWLVETVELDVALDPTRTRVRLALMPNPQAAAPAAVVLDGDELVLRSVALHGEALAADAFVVPQRQSSSYNSIVGRTERFRR